MHPSSWRLAPLTGLIIVAACAPSAAPASRPETVYGVPGASTLTINPDNSAVSSSIAAPLDAVWRFLPAAFDSAGVPIGIIDPVRRQMGNEGFKVRQRLGGARLSTYFECGTTQIGPNADSYEMFITVLARLEADGPTRTKMSVSVTAAAKPMQFAQDYSRCASKSTLEKRIADAVAAGVRR